MAGKHFIRSLMLHLFTLDPNRDLRSTAYLCLLFVTIADSAPEPSSSAYGFHATSDYVTDTSEGAKCRTTNSSNLLDVLCHGNIVSFYKVF